MWSPNSLEWWTDDPPNEKWPVQKLDGPYPEMFAEALLAGLTTLNAGTTKQLAVLLLRHALAALLDYRAHGRSLCSSSVTLPGAASNGWSAQARAVF
jgi:hypothetical protein